MALALATPERGHGVGALTRRQALPSASGSQFPRGISWSGLPSPLEHGGPASAQTSKDSQRAPSDLALCALLLLPLAQIPSDESPDEYCTTVWFQREKGGQEDLG